MGFTNERWARTWSNNWQKEIQTVRLKLGRTVTIVYQYRHLLLFRPTKCQTTTIKLCWIHTINFFQVIRKRSSSEEKTNWKLAEFLNCLTKKKQSRTRGVVTTVGVQLVIWDELLVKTNRAVKAPLGQWPTFDPSLYLRRPAARTTSLLPEESLLRTSNV